VRVAGWRFLATMDPSGPATFAENNRKAAAAAKALRELDPARQFGVALKLADDALQVYGTAFQDAAKALEESRVVFEDDIK
ncbi:hypothetical protein, partial [Kribbella sp. DT2]